MTTRNFWKPARYWDSERYGIHPERGGGTKVSRQSQRGTGRDATPTIDDLIDTLVRQMYGVGKLPLRQTHQDQEFHQQPLTGMGWWPIGWYA